MIIFMKKKVNMWSRWTCKAMFQPSKYSELLRAIHFQSGRVSNPNQDQKPSCRSESGSGTSWCRRICQPIPGHQYSTWTQKRCFGCAWPRRIWINFRHHGVGSDCIAWWDTPQMAPTESSLLYHYSMLNWRCCSVCYLLLKTNTTTC